MTTQSQPKFDLLRHLPMRWVVWWLLVPNLAIIMMWPVGGPAMAHAIFVGGLVGLFVSFSRNAFIRILGMLAVFAIILATYVANSFNIAVENISYIPTYIGELNLAHSPEYVAAIVLIIVTLVPALYFGAKTPKLEKGKPLFMAIAAIALLVNMDTIATAGTRGTYKASAPAGTEIDSAVLQTGITPDRLASRNLVIIVVESWGVPVHAFDKQVEKNVWESERWSERYKVSSGTTAYFGSTTNAEVRELCNVWADHITFDFENSHCLPERFREAGFSTHALHSFAGTFFDRNLWYPSLGFEKIQFADALIAGGARSCDGVFPGACDADVPREIASLLRSNRDQRNLVYWLTLNAHLPVPASQSLGTASCHLGTAEWRDAFPMLCSSYQVHERLADSLTAEILRSDFPESDIIIVGDHMPPFFPRSIRSRFDADEVPYFYLQNRKALEVGAETGIASTEPSALQRAANDRT